MNHRVLKTHPSYLCEIKKDKSLRARTDLRQVNQRTIRDAYYLPKIEESFDALAEANYSVLST